MARCPLCLCEGHDETTCPRHPGETPTALQKELAEWIDDALVAAAAGTAVEPPIAQLGNAVQMLRTVIAEMHEEPATVPSLATVHAWRETLLGVDRRLVTVIRQIDIARALGRGERPR